MRQKYWYLGSICSVALTIASIIACGGDPSLQEECVMDTDCSIGTVCDGELGFCVALCNDDSECAAGEICDPRASAPGSTEKVCQADPSSNNNNMQCTDNEDCNTDEICQNGTCVQVGPTTVYRYIQILDVSAGNDSCGQSSSARYQNAGADIFSVVLTDSTGTEIGFGQYVDFEQGEGPNELLDFSFFDGRAPDVDNGGQCPNSDGTSSLRNDAVLSLGCGGYLLLSLNNPNGTPINLENGMQIFVGEYAPVCNNGASNDTEGTDRYVVNICTDAASASNSDVSSCTRQLGRGSEGGNAAFTINGL